MPISLGVPLYPGAVDGDKIAVGAVTIDKIDEGALMVSVPVTSAYAHSNSVSWVTAWTLGRVYIPANAKSLSLSGKMKSSSVSGVSYMRFGIGGLFSADTYVAGTAFAWGETADLDVSSLSGWHQVTVQQKTNNASYGADLAFVSMAWKH